MFHGQTRFREASVGSTIISHPEIVVYEIERTIFFWDVWWFYLPHWMIFQVKTSIAILWDDYPICLVSPSKLITGIQIMIPEMVLILLPLLLL